MELPQRKQIRLPRYDYSRPGYYFVTVCIQNRSLLLGKVKDGKMVLSVVGEAVNNWFLKIPETFGNAVLDIYQIMPNHIHGIVVINHLLSTGRTPVSTRKNI
jgi:putative transposase